MLLVVPCCLVIISAFTRLHSSFIASLSKSCSISLLPSVNPFPPFFSLAQVSQSHNAASPFMTEKGSFLSALVLTKLFFLCWDISSHIIISVCQIFTVCHAKSVTLIGKRILLGVGLNIDSIVDGGLLKLCQFLPTNTFHFSRCST